MSDTSGPTLPLPLMRFDLDSLSWKTCAATSLWDLPMSLPTLPPWGCLRNGELFALPTPGPVTLAQGSLLLPTPTMQDGENTAGPSQMNRNTLPLNTLVTLLPTPTVMDMGSNYTPEEWQAWKAAQKAQHQNGNGHGASLTQEAITMLPTPTAQAAKHGEKPDTTANGFGTNLWDLPTMLPTPTATDTSKHAGQPRHKRVGHQPRIADVIEYLPQWNGENTDPPYGAGSTSLDDPHQTQLFPA